LTSDVDKDSDTEFCNEILFDRDCRSSKNCNTDNEELMDALIDALIDGLNFIDSEIDKL